MLDPRDQKLGKTKGGCSSKLSVAFSCVGLAMSIRLVPGNEHDRKSGLDTLEEHIKDNMILADKG